MSRRPVPLWRFDDPVAPLAALLARGGVLAIPTESSYGLAVPPGNAAGVEAIYRIKRRERGKPLPVVIAGLEQLAGLGIDPNLPILKALSAFWPGPLTAVLPIAGAGAAGAPPAAAGTGTLAIRIPGHPQLVRLLSRLGHGLTATSANRSGGEPVLDPLQAAELLAGEPAMVVDGGLLPGGLPSTLVAAAAPAAAAEEEAVGALDRDWRDWGGWRVEVLRAGRLPVERLRERLPLIGAGARAGTARDAARLC
ncbi:MAG TPA: L-threonylcarbamoyladenylate synthase [Thermoanaerobaculia bacterium]|nr:L-threonylcarbamoyladenylate synthase [Thermoanaerobaculia bacterium]